jgi:hypothetical protein
VDFGLQIYLAAAFPFGVSTRLCFKLWLATRYRYSSLCRWRSVRRSHWLSSDAVPVTCQQVSAAFTDFLPSLVLLPHLYTKYPIFFPKISCTLIIPQFNILFFCFMPWKQTINYRTLPVAHSTHCTIYKLQYASLPYQPTVFPTPIYQTEVLIEVQQENFAEF